MATLLLCLAATSPARQASDAEQLFRAAVAAQKNGDDASAIRDYRAVLQLRPDVLEARANLGAALAHLGRFDEAIAEYRVALEKSPANNALRFNLALAYYKKSAWPQAAQELGALYKTAPDNLRLATLLGDCYSHLNRDADALNLLTPLAAAQADDFDLAWAYGKALIHAGRLKEGLIQVEKLAQKSANPQAYLLAGDTALRLNEFERARANADEAFRIDPKLPGIATLRGRILEYLGDDEGAVAALQAALATNPSDFDAHVTLGAILNTQRALPAARRHLERALQLNPTSVLARYELARVERAQDQLEQAAADFEKVVRADPNWLPPHVELAALYFKLKRPQDGQRERLLVDKLTAEQEQRKEGAPALSAPPLAR